ncbi:CHAT domain-containing protein [Plantactinospora sonchi]|uniref:CHAT domain-containing protein n=1 Tax=Plantactinospora sonchi TaxID=1544735 RepID=A0ABU7RUC5_9ACTN
MSDGTSGGVHRADHRTNHRPTVRVYTGEREGALWLDLEAPGVGATLTVRLAPLGEVRQHGAKLNAGLGRILREHRGRVDAPVPADPEERARRNLVAAGDSLAALGAYGRAFLFDVLTDPQNDSRRLVEFLRTACPTWRVRSGEPPLIHVITRSDHVFPWELLPLFEPARPPRVRDQPELEQAALAFPGYAAVVERRDRDDVQWNLDLAGWDRLPLRMVYHAGYPGARQELDFFRGRGDQLRLEGPYPGDVGKPDAPSLAAQLCDPALGVDGSRGVPADQVLHFACDCEARPEDPDGHGYLLADEQRRELRVLLRELKSDLVEHWAAQGPGRVGTHRTDKPLVFLNACGTAVMDPHSAISLLQPFQRNGNRGVIGTSANIPDGTAAVMSRWFYTGLLTGSTVGQALHEAKWRLLQDRGSVLGLLYSLHGLAGMRITPVPVPARRRTGGSEDPDGRRGPAPDQP